MLEYSAHARVGFHKAFLVLRIVWADMKLKANFWAGFEKPWTHPSVVAVVLPMILWAADGAGSDGTIASCRASNKSCSCSVCVPRERSCARTDSFALCNIDDRCRKTDSVPTLDECVKGVVGSCVVDLTNLAESDLIRTRKERKNQDPWLLVPCEDSLSGRPWGQ